MSLFNHINFITIAIAGILITPIAVGFINPATPQRMRTSILSLINQIEFITGILLTFYFRRIILYDGDNAIMVKIFERFPALNELLSVCKENITANIIFLFLLFAVVQFLIRILTAPVTKFLLIPFTNRLSSAVSSLGITPRRILGGVWQVPRSIWLVLIASLLLNLYVDFGTNASYKQYINGSAAYQTVNEKVVSPLLGSELAQKIPVLLNDSFQKINGQLSRKGSEGGMQGQEEISPFSGNIPIVEYFNGVTLEQAIQSNEEIDQTAKKIVGSEQDEKKKAYLIYRWICSNIRYDYDKAEKIVEDPAVVTSGSEVAYSERKGVCFDYSTLYVSMCRAVGLKVRLVTGLGYSGIIWGDHAWNQVYDTKEQRWISLDTTFGSAGLDSFDTYNFANYHKDSDIQGEW